MAPDTSAAASSSAAVSLPRAIWRFLTQPTEPITLLPPLPPSAMPAFLRPSANAATAATMLEGAAANSSSTLADGVSGVASGSNGLVESLGIAGALLAVEVARFAWRRYHRPTEATTLQLQQAVSQRRIHELTTCLALSPHPEGGFYRRIFQSPWMLRDETAMAHEHDESRHPVRAAASSPLGEDPAAALASALAAPAFFFPRPLATSIYFLLTSKDPLSHLHRLPAEEQWVWIEGDPLLIVQVDSVTGEYSERLLGPIRITTPQPASEHTMFLQPCSTAPAPTAASHSALAPPTSLSFPTTVVPGGVWFGARLCDPTRFEPPTEDTSSPLTDLFHLFTDTPSSAPPSPSAAFPSSSPQRFGYTLVCCVVSPGFQFDDFRLMGGAEFDQLTVDAKLRQRMQAAGIAPQAREAKLQEAREMVLNEAGRGAAMETEAKLAPPKVDS